MGPLHGRKSTDVRYVLHRRAFCTLAYGEATFAVLSALARQRARRWCGLTTVLADHGDDALQASCRRFGNVTFKSAVACVQSLPECRQRDAPTALASRRCHGDRLSKSTL